MDDVTWFVEGSSIREVREQLEWCAEESFSWAEGNAVRFEVSKTEAVLLSRKRGLVQAAATEPVRVGDLFFPSPVRPPGGWECGWILPSPCAPAEGERSTEPRPRRRPSGEWSPSMD